MNNPEPTLRMDDLPTIESVRLVKSLDLNHHGTLYAGRMAEWVVEIGFLTTRAALRCSPDHLVCLRIHGLDFRHRVEKGASLRLRGEVVYVGRTSITVHVTASPLQPDGSEVATTDALLTYVHIVEREAVPHGLKVAPPESPDLRRWWEIARAERAQRQSAVPQGR